MVNASSTCLWPTGMRKVADFGATCLKCILDDQSSAPSSVPAVFA